MRIIPKEPVAKYEKITIEEHNKLMRNIKANYL